MPTEAGCYKFLRPTANGMAMRVWEKIAGYCPDAVLHHLGEATDGFVVVELAEVKGSSFSLKPLSLEGGKIRLPIGEDLSPRRLRDAAHQIFSLNSSKKKAEKSLPALAPPLLPSLVQASCLAGGN